MSVYKSGLSNLYGIITEISHGNGRVITSISSVADPMGVSTYILDRPSSAMSLTHGGQKDDRILIDLADWDINGIGLVVILRKAFSEANYLVMVATFEITKDTCTLENTTHKYKL